MKIMNESELLKSAITTRVLTLGICAFMCGAFLICSISTDGNRFLFVAGTIISAAKAVVAAIEIYILIQ